MFIETPSVEGVKPFDAFQYFKGAKQPLGGAKA